MALTIASREVDGVTVLDLSGRITLGEGSVQLREAAVNAVMHGNEYDPAKQITATFENTGKDLVFSIADQGKGLDPDTLPDPLAQENLLRGTGRGIFIIRSFMDEVHFRQLHPGTELTLVKHLPAGETT